MLQKQNHTGVLLMSTAIESLQENLLSTTSPYAFGDEEPARTLRVERNGIDSGEVEVFFIEKEECFVIELPSHLSLVIYTSGITYIGVGRFFPNVDLRLDLGRRVNTHKEALEAACDIHFNLFWSNASALTEDDVEDLSEDPEDLNDIGTRLYPYNRASVNGLPH